MMPQTKYQGSRPCGSRQKIFSCFPYISLCKICDLQGRAKKWPHGYNLNKLGRDLLGDIKALGLVVPDKKTFLCFPNISHKSVIDR